MVTIIRKGASKKRVQEIITRFLSLKKHKGLDASKYIGKLPSIGDPLSIQKELRNEWE